MEALADAPCRRLRTPPPGNVGCSARREALDERIIDGNFGFGHELDRLGARALPSMHYFKVRYAATTASTFERQFQLYHPVLDGCLVVPHQEHALRGHLSVRQQCLLQSHGALLTQGLQLGVADLNMLADSLRQEIDLGCTDFRL